MANAHSDWFKFEVPNAKLRWGGMCSTMLITSCVQTLKYIFLIWKMCENVVAMHESLWLEYGPQMHMSCTSFKILTSHEEEQPYITFYHQTLAISDL